MGLAAVMTGPGSYGPPQLFPRILTTLLTASLVLNVYTKCLIDKPDIQPKRHLYFDRESHPIVIEASARASHRLVSHVLEILLTEVLGYASVRVQHDHNSIEADRALNRLAGCPHPGCPLPQSMVSLEVWSKVGFSPEPWLQNGDVIDAGPLGPFGRFGWYVPTSDVENNWRENSYIIDHWRALTMTNVTSQFNLASKLALEENFLTRPSLVNKTHFCEQWPSREGGICHKGLLYGRKCMVDKKARHNDKCAVLVSSFPDLDDGLLEHRINQLGLNVIVAWIGAHLDHFVYECTSQNLPTLFFNWVPNTLTATGNYSRIQFPSCYNDNMNMDADSNRSYEACNFPVHQLSKFMWGALRKQAPEAHSTISNMHFSQEEYEELLKLHTDLNPAFSLDDQLYQRTACLWLQQNEAKWSAWIPKNLSNRTKIYLGGLYPLTGDIWNLPGVIPGVEMAVDFINNSPTILKNYELVALKQDTQCEAKLAMKQFINYVENETHPVAGIIGPAYTDTAEAVAGVSMHYNTILVSYSAETFLEPDPTTHPLFFRTTPPWSQNGVVFSLILNYFGWSSVVLLAENTRENPAYQAFLKDTFLNSGINVVSDSKVPLNCGYDEVGEIMEDIKAEQTRIIILTSFQQCGASILCRAYRMKMTPKYNYIWFIPDWFTSRWWHSEHCSAEEMLEAIHGYYTLGKTLIGGENDMTISNVTVGEWVNSYMSRVENVAERTVYAAPAYDTVWVFALALHKLLEEYPSSLGTLRSDNTTQRLLYHLNRTKFDGVSGHVAFRANNRPGKVNIRQFSRNMVGLEIEDQFITIGQYSPFRNASEQLLIDKDEIIWPGDEWVGERPQDVPSYCGVENFRALLGVSCDTAIVIANVLGISLFGLVMIICLIIVKKRYDDKVLATRRRMVELGLMADTSWLSLDQWEVSREHVVLNRKLGEGAFGTVYGGEALFDGVWVAVAVKTLKIGSNPEEKLDFLSEAEMMKRFDHANIVKLMGVCTRGEPAYNIMEFMLHGDMKTFLLSRRNMVGQDIKEAEDITTTRLTQMALDVANGLTYLSELRYVHRDIACRNCLVNAAKTVKIGDFGMTRAMFDSDYYRFNKRGMLPVRWMAPESLTDGLFTPSSDVWSYGVLLYEIMTFGSFPYQGLSNKQVLEHVKAGNTIQPPHMCNNLLGDLLRACWSYEPDCRPNITDIVEIFTDNPALIKPCLDAPSTAVAMETTGQFSLDIPVKQKTSVTKGPQPHNRFSISNMSEHSHGGLNAGPDSHGPQNPPSPPPAPMDPFSLLGNMARGATARLPSLSSVIRSPLSRSLSVGEERANAPVMLAPMCTHSRLVSNEIDTSCADMVEQDNRSETGSHHGDGWSADNNMYQLPRHISIPASLEERADSDYCSDHSKDFIHCHMTSALSSMV